MFFVSRNVGALIRSASKIQMVVRPLVSLFIERREEVLTGAVVRPILSRLRRQKLVVGVEALTPVKIVRVLLCTN